MPEPTTAPDHVPLLSPRFVWKITAVVAIMCLVTLAIAATGRMVGKNISRAGNTAETTLYEIVIGNDVLSLPANVIRFQSQRVSGVQNAVDTYFSWPGMHGYSEATRDIFNQTRSADGLIFARIAQATMSRDMSGRFTPIYKRLTDGVPVAGPSGLDSFRLRSGAGYANELMYVERSFSEQPYAIRCLVEDSGTEPDFNTRTGCQRDIAIGEDLSVTYRFSIDLLPHWREIERDVRNRLESALIR
ncbi:MAG: hypothetical protein KUA43_02050 [Hoeflea sp.]|uniref:hypothetical protein n=1 Tax=Hoeflea sp. TaxID=1940281 RepID=UPI001DA61E50|nr:hypothetical protein [Hoeflea sp.]MBU4530656.1 hypothetical protein [Alphaproteobacteria bacterium]MBU4544876.1 hypothetical protein [Alphaproteobacteria bacterium]MBU4552019.1 hypothetical protein [Alphaproteobacteria bacterium]MBV1722208.1 hypothetical protein [Hoeflea sp.]MBV1761770.1 hypothetical protein [Hoeflea sp.]